jgi:hypothetical protein
MIIENHINRMKEKRNEMNDIFSFKRKVFVDQGFCIEIH